MRHGQEGEAPHQPAARAPTMASLFVFHFSDPARSTKFSLARRMTVRCVRASCVWTCTVSCNTACERELCCATQTRHVNPSGTLSQHTLLSPCAPHLVVFGGPNGSVFRPHMKQAHDLFNSRHSHLTQPTNKTEVTAVATNGTARCERAWWFASHTTPHDQRTRQNRPHHRGSATLFGPPSCAAGQTPCGCIFACMSTTQPQSLHCAHRSRSQSHRRCVDHSPTATTWATLTRETHAAAGCTVRTHARQRNRVKPTGINETLHVESHPMRAGVWKTTLGVPSPVPYAPQASCASCLCQSGRTQKRYSSPHAALRRHKHASAQTLAPEASHHVRQQCSNRAASHAGRVRRAHTPPHTITGHRASLDTPVMSSPAAHCRRNTPYPCCAISRQLWIHQCPGQTHLLQPALAGCGVSLEPTHECAPCCQLGAGCGVAPRECFPDCCMMKNDVVSWLQRSLVMLRQVVPTRVKKCVLHSRLEHPRQHPPPVLPT